MIRCRAPGERGAVFPLYIWMVTGLLVIALAFFVFAQAAVIRNGGQSAADAAALAAATEARDGLYDDFLDAIDGDGDLGDVLTGEDFQTYTEAACEDAAPQLAASNDADVSSCDPDAERTGYIVGVTTRDTLGNTVIPGTESQAANAEATAVIRALCEVENEGGGEIELSCEDEDLSFDPDDEDELPEARELFQVHLAD
jgi:hypothetical protein